VLLLYNAMLEGRGHPKFRTLIDKYDLLQHLQPTLLLEESDLERFNKGEEYPRSPATT
jgi:hypothetical protein